MFGEHLGVCNMDVAGVPFGSTWGRERSAAGVVASITVNHPTPARATDTVPKMARDGAAFLWPEHVPSSSGSPKVHAYVV